MMANLAAAFASRGLGVTLLTAQWQAEWPTEITYRGVPVVRLPNPPTRGWGTLRYMQRLGRWLREHQGQYDLVYVSMLKHDAYAALKAVDRQTPVVLRAEGAGYSGDCVWQLEANCGSRIKRRCLRADALIGPGPTVCRELTAAGYPRRRIHYLPNAVSIPRARSAEGRQKARREARAALLSVNSELACPAHAPLAIYTGRLHEAKGLSHLVDAWSTIVGRWPNARLWLVGEGPYERTLHEQIHSRNLAGRVIMPGVFDSVDELLEAADVFVLPSLAEGMSLSMLEAMAAGLPVVASDISANRDLVTDAETGLLAAVGDADALAAAVTRLFDEPELASRLGAAARQSVAGRYSIDTTMDEHLKLFDSLL